MRHRHALDGILIWHSIEEGPSDLGGVFTLAFSEFDFPLGVSTSTSGWAFFSSIAESLASNKANAH
jgi:hypothetical protein